MLLTDENIPLLIAALAFVVISLLSIGIMIHVLGVRSRRRMLDKIRTADGDWTAIGQENSGLDLSGSPATGLAGFLSAIGMQFKPSKPADETEVNLRFARAGLRQRSAVTVFWGVKALLVAILPTAFLVLAAFFFKTQQTNQVLLGAAFLALLGLFLPDLWLRLKTKARKERLFKGFPDALDLLVVCIEAGMGLDAAISRVGEELNLSHPELGEEFKRLNLELRAGKPRATALRNLASRTDIDDVNSLVTLLIQTDRFGTSVAQALKVFADSFRTTRFQRAEEFAAKLATKLIFPLALCIFPAVFVVGVGPAAVQLYHMFFKG